MYTNANAYHYIIANNYIVVSCMHIKILSTHTMHQHTVTVGDSCWVTTGRLGLARDYCWETGGDGVSCSGD